MKKQDIKKDPIRDRMLGFLNQVNDNPKKFLQYLVGISATLLIVIIYTNSESNKLDDYNLSSSINQNRYIDGDRETAVNNFKNILNEYSGSESYNQAFIYSINNAIESNDIDLIAELIDDNKFKSSDNTLQALFYNLLGNYYTSIDDTDRAVNYYKKAVKTSAIGDHLFQFKLNLLYLYYNEKNYADYTSLIDDIDIDEIKSFQLKSKYEQLPDIN